MRIRLRAGLHQSAGGYNFRVLTAQHEKCNAPMSGKDNCDTRSSLPIPKIGALDYIGRFLPYLNGEQETRREAREGEGTIHPKIASPTASLRWAVTAASHGAAGHDGTHLENLGEHDSDVLKEPCR